MLFTPENAAKMMSGEKDQTRRIVKEGERGYLFLSTTDYYQVLDSKHHLRWQVGKSYAVQPGRGKPAIGRRVLVAIRKERLQDISPDDCFAEGIRLPTLPHETPDKFTEAYRLLWNKINYLAGDTWEDNPEVWVLEFEPVKATEEAATQ